VGSSRTVCAPRGPLASLDDVCDFIESVLGEAGLARSVLIVATSDESPLLRVRAAAVACTVAEAAPDHPLFAEEMFQPILMVCRVADLSQAVALANESSLGLTGGCYGSDEEVRYFLDHIEAGVVYVNRPQGATTGAWPGYQAFGGWKGSGSTGKAIGSFYYLPLYLREQSQTVVE